MKEFFQWTIEIVLVVGFFTWMVYAIVKDTRTQREKCMSVTNNPMFCWERYR